MRIPLPHITMCCLIFGLNFLFGQNNTEKIDNAIIEKIESIQDADRSSREKLIKLLETKGRESKEFIEQNKIVHQLDSVNTVYISNFLDKYGWLGSNIIGKKANITLFLVVQHSDFQTQQKYLPMLKDAVQMGNALPSNMAMLEDRVLMLDGKKQIYGSQLALDKTTGEYYVHPIEDPENVDNRRAKVGLQKISDYLSYWNIKWDIEKHKKRKLNKTN